MTDTPAMRTAMVILLVTFLSSISVIKLYMSAKRSRRYLVTFQAGTVLRSLTELLVILHIMCGGSFKELFSEGVTVKQGTISIIKQKK